MAEVDGTEAARSQSAAYLRAFRPHLRPSAVIPNESGQRHSRDETAAREVLEKVEAYGRKGFVIKANLARVVETRAMVAETVERFSRLDILVNNAGRRPCGTHPHAAGR